MDNVAPIGGFRVKIEEAARRTAFENFFHPRSVALIGATEAAGSVGRALMENLMSFPGQLYPVNPKRREILGAPAFPRLSDLPERVDLVVIATPAPTVPAIIAECATLGVEAVIIISAGFRETGEAGCELERKIFEIASKAGIRIIGPNCLGVMAPHVNLNATFGSRIAQPGNIAFLSQSGALCTAVLDWSYKQKIGFSAFISAGCMLDVNWGALLTWFGEDPLTKSIVIYMESVGDARSFLTAAREVSLNKPIIVIKGGRTAEASKAAASHTGSMTGSDEVLDAAFRRAGVLRVNTIEELFDMAELLGKQPRPKGPRLTIVTNAGGPAVLATDMLIGVGGQLSPLAAETIEAYNQMLPPHWSRGNPADILGDAGAQTYGKALQLALDDPNTNGALVILTPQAMTDPTACAKAVAEAARGAMKPVLTSWMGASEVEAGRQILASAGIPTYDYPDAAARAFVYMWGYSWALKGLYETPALLTDIVSPLIRASTGRSLEAIRQTGRTLLTEAESKLLLREYGIPATQTEIAESEDAAVRAALKMGMPVVLKLHSTTLTHKTDVGGVQLDLQTEAEVRAAWRRIHDSLAAASKLESFEGVTVQPMISGSGSYELIVGSSVDSQFGPVIMFGWGGQLTEILRDTALGLPPLNATLARRVMQRTRIYKALEGVRGRKPVDLSALEALLIRFSQLCLEHPVIKEIEINPLLVSNERIIALDARVILHDRSVTQLPRPAIRPYPVEYVSAWEFPDGTNVTIRPIKPEDEPLLVRFHSTLSEQTVYYRYFGALKLSERTAHDRLARVCFNDYDREIALVAEIENAATSAHEIIGVGRLSKLPDGNSAEFAVVVSDAYQGRGLGSELLRLLTIISKQERVTRVVGHILPENSAMQKVATDLGYKVKRGHDEYTAELKAKR